MVDLVGIIKDYWYILVFLVLLICIWFWSKLDISTKMTLKKIFNFKVVIAILFIGTWYFWAKYGDITEIKQANLWMPLALVTIIAAYNFIGKLRYESQQIVCANGFHGSYSKPPLEVNGFLIFAIDSFNAGGLSWDYAGRILVLRKETTELFGSCAISIASPNFASIYELDPDVKNVIETNEFLKTRFLGSKPIYYGWFDDLNFLDWTEEDLKRFEEAKENIDDLYLFLKKELGINNPSLKEMYRLYRNACKAYNKQTEQYDSTVEAVEKGVEHHKRVRDAYVEKRDYWGKSPEGHEEV